MNKRIKIKPLGEWKCPQCKYRLTKRILHPEGMVTAVNPSQEPEYCPNDGTLLVPLKGESFEQN